MLISNIKDPALRALALERKGTRPYDSLGMAFTWGETPEGWDFWNDVDNMVIEYLDKGTPKPEIPLEPVMEALKRIEDKLDQLLAPIQDQPVSKARFSIQDLADGKCAVINDGTVEQLQQVLAAAFPKDTAKPGGDHDYYFQYDRDYWDSELNDVCLPTQSVKDFL